MMQEILAAARVTRDPVQRKFSKNLPPSHGEATADLSAKNAEGRQTGTMDDDDVMEAKIYEPTALSRSIQEKIMQQEAALRQQGDDDSPKPENAAVAGSDEKAPSVSDDDDDDDEKIEEEPRMQTRRSREAKRAAEVKPEPVKKKPRTMTTRTKAKAAKQVTPSRKRKNGNQPGGNVSVGRVPHSNALFPKKLREICEVKAYAPAIRWDEEWGGVIIRDPDRMRDEILPKYFFTKGTGDVYKSFRRQLVYYGFEEVTRGKHAPERLRVENPKTGVLVSICRNKDPNIRTLADLDRCRRYVPVHNEVTRKRLLKAQEKAFNKAEDDDDDDDDELVVEKMEEKREKVEEKEAEEDDDQSIGSCSVDDLGDGIAVVSRTCPSTDGSQSLLSDRSQSQSSQDRPHRSTRSTSFDDHQDIAAILSSLRGQSPTFVES